MKRPALLFGFPDDRSFPFALLTRRDLLRRDMRPLRERQTGGEAAIGLPPQNHSDAAQV